jgi:hypothetical protein
MFWSPIQKARFVENFNALGTPAADKKLIVYEGGHRNPITRPDLLGEIIAWFDHYLGHVREH